MSNDPLPSFFLKNAPSLIELSEKFLIEAIAIFLNYILNFYVVVEKYVVFEEVKQLYIITGLSLFIGSLSWEIKKDKVYNSIYIIYITLCLFTLSIGLLIYSGFQIYIKLGDLHDDPFRFLMDYSKFVIINIIIILFIDTNFKFIKNNKNIKT